MSLKSKSMRSLHPWPLFPPNLDRLAAHSLSLLFTLEELLTAFTLLEQLPNPCSSKDLEKLLLFSLENPLAQKGGSLDKLCFYCEILLQASEREEEEIPMLLEQMRSCILLSKSKLIKKSDAMAPFRKEIAEKLALFFTALRPFFFQARSNENVLMRLLERRERLNHFLGPRTVENLLRELFPLGIEELRVVMSEGYARRGFEDFFFQQEPLIDALEWDSPCHPLLQTL